MEWIEAWFPFRGLSSSTFSKLNDSWPLPFKWHQKLLGFSRVAIQRLWKSLVLCVCLFCFCHFLFLKFSLKLRKTTWKSPATALCFKTVFSRSFACRWPSELSLFLLFLSSFLMGKIWPSSFQRKHAEQ